MLKNKIYTILPYWLIGLSLIVSIQGAFFLISRDTGKTTLKQNKIFPQVLGATTPVRGQEEDKNIQLTKTAEPDLSKIEAESFLIFDLESGENLLERNSQKKLGIASLTKLLTAFVTYNHADLNSELTVSQKNVVKINPVLGLIPGDQVKAIDVFNAMLVGSCNDAALTLAYFVGGSKENFVSLMNSQAKQIGMDNSNFTNPFGFDSFNNFSTASDLKLLITQVEKLSAFSNLGRKTSYSFSGKLKQNYFTISTNKLLADHPDIWAIKTGYTDATGGAMATKIEKQGRQLVILVLGSSNREADTLELKKQLEASFN